MNQLVCALELDDGLTGVAASSTEDRALGLGAGPQSSLTLPLSSSKSRASMPSPLSRAACHDTKDRGWTRLESF